MKMLDFNGDVTQACFQMEYKGYLISVSNLYRINLIEVVIFCVETNRNWSAETLISAMQIIDHVLDKKVD